MARYRGATTSSLATATINITETSQFQRLAFAIQNGVPCDATASTRDGGAAGSITITVDNRTVPTITTMMQTTSYVIHLL